ncbi:unnamed protein product [Linum trigynum]|uniref:Uncharacterized protein n=1 Tax=Linum trigynum TaxID=586398 RepID=A0AAV2CEM9_9ROSI
MRVDPTSVVVNPPHAHNEATEVDDGMELVSPDQKAPAHCLKKDPDTIVQEGRDVAQPVLASLSQSGLQEPIHHRKLFLDDSEEESSWRSLPGKSKQLPKKGATAKGRMLIKATEKSQLDGGEGPSRAVARSSSRCRGAGRKKQERNALQDPQSRDIDTVKESEQALSEESLLKKTCPAPPNKIGYSSNLAEEAADSDTSLSEAGDPCFELKSRTPLSGLARGPRSIGGRVQQVVAAFETGMLINADEQLGAAGLERDQKC